MASTIKENTEEFAYIACPNADITGCDKAIIMKGYCMAGFYCTEDCAYAWPPGKDNA